MTAEEYARLPEDGMRHELRRGELITTVPPGFRHERVTSGVAFALRAFVAENGLGEVAAGDPGFHLASEPDTVRGPDIASVRRERIEAIGFPEGFFPGAPDLAIEVVSPGDAYTELQEKAFEWLTAGTRLVLAVDPRRRTVTAYRSAGDIRELSGDDVVDAGDAVSGWSVSVADLLG
jgi:Uma2 family endonuclease